MNKLNKFFLYALLGSLVSFTSCKDDEEVPTYTSGFEELNIPEGANAFYGQDKTGEKSEDGTLYSYNYVSTNVSYSLNFISDQYGERWNGVAYSSQTDNTKEGVDGMLVAMPGKGANNSKVYAVMNGTDTVTFVSSENAPTEKSEVRPQSIQITNNAYAYSVIKKGNQFSKKFGGTDGNDEDFFKVIITGLDANDKETGKVEFLLADYRFEDNTKDYIVDSWERVDLSPLGVVTKLSFSLESSDTGDWGINTPAYFAFDNLVSQPAKTE